MESKKKLCAELLRAFKISEKVRTVELINFSSKKSQLYALGPIYIFNYLHNRYYVVDDYSLGDDPALVKNILQESNHLLKGKIIKSPLRHTADDTRYALSLDGTQYYLWEEAGV